MGYFRAGKRIPGCGVRGGETVRRSAGVQEGDPFPVLVKREESGSAGEEGGSGEGEGVIYRGGR
jgi:hypothetical protein